MEFTAKIISAFSSFATIVGGVLAIVGGIAFTFNAFVPGVQLLRKVNHGKHPVVGYLLALIEWLTIFLKLGATPRFAHARVFVEHQLLSKRKRNSAEWNTELNNLLRKANENPTIVVDHCFDIESCIEAAAVYHRELQHHAKKGRLDDVESNTFLTRISIQQGFVAPLHLIHGLLSRFNQDWQPVIDLYGKLNSRTDIDALSLTTIQLSNWNTWLMWGPSVPICNCEMWGDFPCWQFGYGDENNSLPMVLSNGHKQIEFLEYLSNLEASESYTPLADQVAVSGQLAWANRTDLMNSFGEAQIGLARPENLESEMVIEWESFDPVGATRSIRARRYYSAYIWVLLVITDDQNNLIYDQRGELWKGFLPFFVHANIAEHSYEFYVKQLCAKVLAGVEFIRNRVETDQNLAFHYSCAVDDTNCGEECLISKRNETKIIDLMRASVDQSVSDCRIIFPNEPSYADAIQEKGLVACHLHEFVSDYLANLSNDE